MFNIILVVIAVIALSGCRSHRETVRHETARYQRAILDSTATGVDSLARRDSVSLWWLVGEVSLEMDSVDYRITWDSVGHPARIAGKRLVSRHSSSAGQKAAAAAVEETHEEVLRQRTLRDSTAAVRVQDKRVETEAGCRPGWLELTCCGVLLALAVGGVVYLKGLAERWSKRR